MTLLNKKGITEATIYYIIAVVLGIIAVVIYILFVGPSNILNAISNFFSGFTSLVTGGLA
jgi:Flp pilus assembly pilin Flp